MPLQPDQPPCLGLLEPSLPAHYVVPGHHHLCTKSEGSDPAECCANSYFTVLLKKKYPHKLLVPLLQCASSGDRSQKRAGHTYPPSIDQSLEADGVAPREIQLLPLQLFNNQAQGSSEQRLGSHAWQLIDLETWQ